MKKLLFTLFFALVGVCSVNAQEWFLGGSLGFRTYDSDYQVNNKSTDFWLRPEFGYNTSGKWSFGASIGFETTSYDQSDSYTSISFTPYARLRFYEIGNLSLFADGLISFVSAGAGTSNTSYSIGIQPGLSYKLNKHFGMIARLGFVGFTGGDYKSENGFALGVHNDLSFGLYYYF